MAGMATLHELQTVYSLRDLYDLLEIATIKAENERIASEMASKKSANV